MLPERFDTGERLPVRFITILYAVLLLFVIAPISIAKSSGAPAYDTISFAKELGRLRSELEIAGQSPETLHSIRDSLPASWIVETDTQHYEVPTSTLAGRLTKAEKVPEVRQLEIGRAQDYLSALGAEASSFSEARPPDLSLAKSALDQILARPEYAHAASVSWWDRLRRQINDMISEALRRVLSSVGSQKTFGQLLLWLGVCAAAIFIAFSLFRRWFRAARLEEMQLQSAKYSKRTWQQWVFASRAAAERRDYRLAIHCAYWGGITRLQDLGAIAPDRARTPREYLQSLSKSKLILPEAHASQVRALSAMTSRLEKTWYGFNIATEADFRDSLVQLEILGCHLP